MARREYPISYPVSDEENPKRSNPWRDRVMYEIYPQSFFDTNNDGIGDLQGVREKLDYLEALGVNAVWFTPIFTTPFVEAGYDVADYTTVDPRYGSNETFLQLVEEVHNRNIKVLIDFVINHTSDQHPWFIQSKSSRDNPKADWYVWKDPKQDGSPPNNWVGNFGGSAWTYVPEREQYYYHAFLPEQADLNWNNEQVQQAMLKSLDYWFEQGIDGARLDAPAFLIEHPDFPDEPENFSFQAGDHPSRRLRHIYTQLQDALPEKLRLFTQHVAKRYPGKLLVTESADSMSEQWKKQLIQLDDGRAHTPFLFSLVSLPWQADAFAQTIQEYYSLSRPEQDVGVWVLGSHDVARLVDRYGSENARSAAMISLTLPQAMPVIYQGDELGMRGQVVDPSRKTNVFARLDPETTRTKDAFRLPMPWTPQENAGFTAPGVEPLFPVAENAQEICVERQMSDSTSLWTLYQRLIDFRKRTDTARHGKLHKLTVEEDVLSYVLELSSQQVRVAINFSGEGHVMSLPHQDITVAISTHDDSPEKSHRDSVSYTLRPHEGIIFTRSNE